MHAHVVLLVEDEALILLDVEAALVEAGFEVVCAKNAAVALKQFDAEPAKFAGLVTDIRLGDGKSGWDIARHVRETSPAMPVVYMSGDSAFEWHAQGVPDSVMIQKPFVIAQIITALSQLLNQPPIQPGDGPSERERAGSRMANPLGTGERIRRHDPCCTLCPLFFRQPTRSLHRGPTATLPRTLI